MFSFNTPSITQHSNTGIFINQHITVQAAAEATGYNIQYLRRLASLMGSIRLNLIEDLDYQNKAYNTLRLKQAMKRFEKVVFPTIFGGYSTSKISLGSILKASR